MTMGTNVKKLAVEHDGDMAAHLPSVGQGACPLCCDKKMREGSDLILERQMGGG